MSDSPDKCPPPAKRSPEHCQGCGACANTPADRAAYTDEQLQTMIDEVTQQVLRRLDAEEHQDPRR